MLLKEIFESRDFRLLLGGQYLAQAADGLAQVAFAEVLVLEPFEQGTPGRILQVLALTLVPYSVIAPFLGVFVDRWQRRKLLVWTNLLRGGLLVTLPIWSEGLPGDTGLYAGVLILLGFGRLFLTTKGAVLPAVLHEHHLLRGNSISGGGGMICALLGGVVGVGTVGWMGPKPSFVVAGVMYGIASLLTRRLADPYAHIRQPDESIGGAMARLVPELVEGVRAIASRARAALPLIGIFLVRTVGFVVAIGAILVIKSEFPDAGDRFGRLSASGFALAAAGVGAFIGAVTAPFLGRRYTKPQLIILGFVVSGLGIMALGGIATIPAVLGLTFVGGYGGFITKVAVDAQVQEALLDRYRGRAFALYDILYNLASVLAGVVIVVFEDIALRPLLVTSGFVTLFLAMALALAMSRAKMLTATNIVEPRADVL